MEILDDGVDGGAPNLNPTIRQVLVTHGITADLFFSPRRWSNLVAARRDAIERLMAKGMSCGRVAQLVGRDPKTVWYHLHPTAHREKRRERARRWKQETLTI